jgi:hypothetical protein
MESETKQPKQPKQSPDDVEKGLGSGVISRSMAPDQAPHIKERQTMSKRSQRLVSGPPPKASQRRNARKVSAKVRKAEQVKPKAPR